MPSRKISTQIAFQDGFGTHNHCHGCGAFNQKGYQIKSYWQGEESVCYYTPEPHQCAGLPTVLNGGVIAALIDCHSIGTAMADGYRRAGREVGSEPQIWYVTANLNVSYIKPAPIDQELTLRGKIISVNGRKTKVECSLGFKDIICARAEVLAIQVERVVG